MSIEILSTIYTLHSRIRLQVQNVIIAHHRKPWWLPLGYVPGSGTTYISLRDEGPEKRDANE